MKSFGSLHETQFGNAIITVFISSVCLARWEQSTPDLNPLCSMMQSTPWFDSSVIFVTVLSYTFWFCHQYTTFCSRKQPKALARKRLCACFYLKISDEILSFSWQTAASDQSVQLSQFNMHSVRIYVVSVQLPTWKL